MRKYILIAHSLFFLLAARPGAAEGYGLRLVTSRFDHPGLEQWAEAHRPADQPAYFPEQDLVRLNTGPEAATLVETADDLATAHGFLTFDYRLYRPFVLSFGKSMEEIEGLIQAEVERKYPGNQQPYVVLISWLENPDREPGFRWMARWENFQRLDEYEAAERGAINDAAEAETLGRLRGSPYRYETALAAGVAEFNRLLGARTDHLIRIDGRFYSAQDTFYTCKCTAPLTIEAFHADSTAFPASAGIKWKKARKGPGNQADYERKKEAGKMSGDLVEASYKDDDGVWQSAQTRIVVVDVDFAAAANADYDFDENEVREYAGQYRLNAAGNPERWKFVPEARGDEVIATIKPADAWPKVSFLGDSALVTQVQRADLGRGENRLTFIANPNATIDKTNPGRGFIRADLNGCDTARLGVLTRDTFAVNVFFILVHEDNDDVQNIPLVGVRSG